MKFRESFVQKILYKIFSLMIMYHLNAIEEDVLIQIVEKIGGFYELFSKK